MFKSLLRVFGIHTDSAALDQFEPIYGLPKQSFADWLARNPAFKTIYEAKLLARSGLSLLHSHKCWWETEAKLRWVECGKLRPQRILRSGSPAAVIVEVANQVSADLIVLGQPQASRWRWLVEERVANTVVRTASCPVLIAIGRKALSTEILEWRGKPRHASGSAADRQVERSTNDREWGY